MGPLDPTPPMVTAGQPDPNDQLIQLLKQKQMAAKQAQMSAGNAQMWDNSIPNPQFQNVTQGARGQPDIVTPNYGDIIGKGIANYMSAKERKSSLDSKTKVEDINNQFMQTTLQSDPTAQKLYGAVQAGIPGADKALTLHLAPKKEALAGLTQFIIGGGDPAMVEQMAARYNIDPAIAKAAAEHQIQRMQEKQDSLSGTKMSIADANNQTKLAIAQGKPAGSTGMTAGEMQSIPIQERIAMAKQSSGRETTESKLRAKNKIQAEQDIPVLDAGITRSKDLITLANNPNLYLMKELGGGLKPPSMDSTGKVVMLRQALKQMTLDASPNGSLGAQISNSDRDFLEQAQVNFDKGDYRTAVAQLNAFQANLVQKREKAARNAGQSAPSVDLSGGPKSPLDYTNSKKVQSKYGADTFEEDAKGLNFGN